MLTAEDAPTTDQASASASPPAAKAAPAKLPAVKPCARAEETYNRFDVTFAPFMFQGKFTINGHAKDFMRRVDTLFVRVCVHNHALRVQGEDKRNQ